MKCSVCQHDISTIATSCAHCGADLTQLSLLDSVEDRFVEVLKDKIAIEGKYVELQKKYDYESKNRRRQLRRLLFGLCLIPILGFICNKGYFQASSPTVDTLSVNDSLKTQMVSLQDSLAFYKETIESLNTQTATNTTTTATSDHPLDELTKLYIIKKDDQLGKLGKYFFGSAGVGHQIRKDNNIPYHSYKKNLTQGDTLFFLPYILDRYKESVKNGTLKE